MRPRLFLVVAALLVAPLARAQGVPPDLIRTRDGGMLRGTIIEKIPGDRVEIQLPNGQLRTVKMSEVEYAGPASASEAAPPTPPAPMGLHANVATIDVPMARLELSSKQKGVTFHRKMSAGRGTAEGWSGGQHGGSVSLAFATSHFERLCTAPCAAQVPQGTYSLGLSLHDGAVVPVEGLDLRGRMRIDGQFNSNANLRRAGWAVAILSLGVGAAMALHTKKNCDFSRSSSDCKTDHPYLIPGLVVGGAGIMVGTLMGFVGDDATIRATPLP